MRSPLEWCAPTRAVYASLLVKGFVADAKLLSQCTLIRARGEPLTNLDNLGRRQHRLATVIFALFLCDCDPLPLAFKD